MWTKEGVKKHKLQCNLKSKSIKYILAQFESTGSRISQLPKEVIFYTVRLSYNESSLRFVVQLDKIVGKFIFIK